MILTDRTTEEQLKACLDLETVSAIPAPGEVAYALVVKADMGPVTASVVVSGAPYADETFCISDGS